MKIYSKKLKSHKDLFVLYLDTEKTGDKDTDVLHIACDFTSIKNSTPKEILDCLIPMISELVYKSYGETKE